MIDIDSRLRVGRGIAKTETEASEEVFRTLQQSRGHPDKPPPTISDGWGGIREAMVQVWGKVPEYKGRGAPTGEEALSRWLEVPSGDQGARRERPGGGKKEESNIRRGGNPAGAF